MWQQKKWLCCLFVFFFAKTKDIKEVFIK